MLLGEVSPSGKLTDTIAYRVADYPSADNFGDAHQNCYEEDIYVGYRYFETFAKDKVRYPFGFGLSYTAFDVCCQGTSVDIEKDRFLFEVSVENTGDYKGKEVVQIYCKAPQGKLGKPSRVLCAYRKTKELLPGEKVILSLEVPFAAIASYDDSGVTDHRFAWILEQGDYNFYVGTDVRSASKAYTFTNEENKILKQTQQALAPVTPFSRIKPAWKDGKLTIEKEEVPLNEVDEKQRRLDCIPKEIQQTGDQGYVLADVLEKKIPMHTFIAQLSDQDLACSSAGKE